MKTPIPSQAPLSFSEYYPRFEDYYADCEMETKKWCVDHVQPDWVAFDVGANIGYYSLLFSRLAPHGHIYAFEPTSTIAMLAKNLQENKCGNVQIVPKAVGKLTGPREGAIYRIWGDAAENQIYDFTSLDAFVAENALQRLDCVKIDVDSYEMDVLLGAEKTLERFDPWIICEFSNSALTLRGTDTLAISEWLMARGYSQALILDKQNVVMKRQLTIPYSVRSGFQYIYPQIDIALDDRTIVEYRLGAAVPGLFKGTVQTHHGASIMLMENGDSMDADPGGFLRNYIMKTAPQQWANSFTLDLNKTTLAAIQAADGYIIEATVMVARGAIILGCFDSTKKEEVSTRRVIKQASAPHILHLIVNRPEDATFLVIQNADRSHMTSVFSILDIRCFVKED